jgi:DNA-binding transcriptional LysR family regulator
MKNFNWEDFRHFAALARALNLAQAAANIGTSQVTVMRRVKALEQELGVTLFVRRRDGHRLTSAGNMLLAIAKKVETSLGSVSDALSIRDQGNSGHVRIATTEIGANWMLLPYIDVFRTMHPNIVLEIDTSPTALDLLEDSETLALRFRRPQEGSHLAKRLGNMKCGIYASSALLSSIKKANGNLLFADIPFVGWAGPFANIGLARWINAVFDGHQANLMLTTLQGQIAAARNGAGAIGLPIFLGDQLKELVQIQEPHETYMLDTWLVIPAQVRKLKRIDSVARFIETSVRRALSLSNSRAKL